MDVLTLVGLFLSSSVVSTIATALITRRKDKAEVEDKYADRLERRVKALEDRLDTYELRERIQMGAINCAHACEHGKSGCPVLSHMEDNPLPMFFERKNEQ